MFDGRPTVVRPGDAFVDFLRDAAHIVDEQSAGFRLHGERERIPQAERPGRAILAFRPGEERIVLGDGAVRVDAQQLTLERVSRRLRGLAGRLVADGDVKLSVLAKVNGPALVARRHGAAQLPLIVPFQQDLLAARLGHVPEPPVNRLTT